MEPITNMPTELLAKDEEFIDQDSKKSHIHGGRVAFSFANCQGGLCKCKDFIPKDLECPPITHHLAICKLRKLLEEPLSKKSYDLHSFYLNNFVNACPDGFFINDMPYLTRVFEILAERIENTGIYRRYLKKFLKMSTFVPLVYSNADKIEGIVHFGKFLSVLGLLAIWLTEKKLRLYVYAALTELLTNTNKKFANCVDLNFRFLAIETSHLPEIITQLIEIVSEDEYDHILKISLTLSQISNIICRKMMVADAANFLLIRLLPCKEQNDTDAKFLINLPNSSEFLAACNITCHVLINLVSSLKKETDKTVLKNITPKENALWAIRYLLRGLLIHGQITRNVRNMLMNFILLCLDIFPYLEIFSSYLASDIAELSIATEFTDKESWLSNITFENNEEDICFKKMLLMSLCFIEKYPLIHTIFESKNVIKGLIKLISPDYKSMWLSNNQDSLRNFALISLNFILPFSYKNFIENNGMQSLIKIIQLYTIPSNTGSEDELLDFLKTLKNIADGNKKIVIHPNIISEVCVLTNELCQQILDNHCISYFDQDVLTHCFCILCSYNTNPNDNYYSIQLILNYLKRVLKPYENDSCTNPQSIISTLNYLWSLLLLSDDNLKMFVKMEGVYVLLDIIDIFPLPVQVIGLGCLVDIIHENQYAVPFVLTWRGSLNKKDIFISLLARIFRYECRKIGTRLNENDIILDMFNPLMGKAQYELIMLHEKCFEPNSALADLLGSARPKIYALLQILNTRYEENVNLINEHYKIGIAPVCRNDMIILHLASNFFALKISESWHELSQALITANIEPIDVDAQMIFTLTEKMQKWNDSVKKNQEIILNLEIKKDINLELRLYEIFRQCRLQSAIDALRELKFFARTTDRMFRESHKNKQKLMMKTYNYESVYKVYYETFIKDLNATALYNMEFVLPYINSVK